MSDGEGAGGREHVATSDGEGTGGRGFGVQRPRGRRSARLVADRRRRRTRRRWLTIGVLAVLAVVVAAVMLSRLERDEPEVAGDEVEPLAAEDGYTLLLVRQGEDRKSVV